VSRQLEQCAALHQVRVLGSLVKENVTIRSGDVRRDATLSMLQDGEKVIPINMRVEAGEDTATIGIRDLEVLQQVVQGHREARSGLVEVA